VTVPDEFQRLLGLHWMLGDLGNEHGVFPSDDSGSDCRTGTQDRYALSDSKSAPFHRRRQRRDRGRTTALPSASRDPQDVDEGRLAGARGAEKYDELALADIEVNGTHRRDFDLPIR